MFFSCNVAFSSMPVFLPTIIQEMGVSSLSAQALSAPPYLVSFFVVLWSAYASDRRNQRSPFIILFALLAAGGYLLIFLSGVLGLPAWLRYIGLYPACMGFFSCVTMIITWTLNNQDSETKKGAGIAILQFFGQCGPLLGTRLFPAEDGPLYLTGMGVCCGFMAGVALLAWTLRLVLRRQNALRLKNSGVEMSDVSRPLVGDEEKTATGLFLFLL
jgi:MFS family permease